MCSFFFSSVLQLGSLVRWTKGREMKWWWHCMPFLEHKFFLSQSICLLAHCSFFFFIGFDFIFVCTFNIEIAFWLGITYPSSLFLTILDIVPVVRNPLCSANIFIKPLECSINFCVNNDNGATKSPIHLELCAIFGFSVDRQTICGRW